MLIVNCNFFFDSNDRKVGFYDQNYLHWNICVIVAVVIPDLLDDYSYYYEYYYEDIDCWVVVEISLDQPGISSPEPPTGRSKTTFSKPKASLNQG